VLLLSGCELITQLVGLEHFVELLLLRPFLFLPQELSQLLL